LLLQATGISAWSLPPTSNRSRQKTSNNSGKTIKQELQTQTIITRNDNHANLRPDMKRILEYC